MRAASRRRAKLMGLAGESLVQARWLHPFATALLRSLFSYLPRARCFNCVDNIMPKEYPRKVFADLAPPWCAVTTR